MSTEVVEEVQAKPVSAAAWKKAALHTVLLPSGAVVGIKIPNLPALCEAGVIPQNLLDAALSAVSAAQKGEEKDPTVEDIAKQREFTDLITKVTVVEPKLSDADLAEIPTEDKEFVVLLATRQRDLDAEGNHIAGLDKSEKFRRFRLLGEFDPTVAGL